MIELFFEDVLEFNLSVDDYVDAKISVGVFAFIICPLIIAFIVKFKESELTNIN